MQKAAMRMAGTGSRSLPRRAAFTVTTLQSASCPPGKDRTWLYDAKQPGLAMMTTAAGAKSFYLYRKVHGRPQRVLIGAFPDVAVDVARKEARRLMGAIAGGIDPQQAKKQARVRGITVAKLWEWFLEHHVKPRKRSAKTDISRYDVHLKAWANKQIEDITTADVAALHHKAMKSASGTTANRVIALLSTMMKKARMIGFDGANPCAGVERYHETSRERYLQPEELPSFWKALERDPDPDWADAFKLALMSGARISNVLSARWSEMQLDPGRWAIPAAKFKTGKAVDVYLSPAALEILNARKGNKSEWVFPSKRSNTGHLAQAAHAWKRICKRAKLSGIRIHDLRRTLGSWQVAAGASLPTVGKTLGHAHQSTTAIYARLQLDSVKQSVDAATAAMILAAKKEGAK